jgi:glycerol kinase
MTVICIDVGSSTLRVSAVSEDGEILETLSQKFLSNTAPGEVEFDAYKIAINVTEMTNQLAEKYRPQYIGITNQRATSVCWNKNTGMPTHNAIGWQDLRTVGKCLELQAQGLRTTPNASATKFQYLVENSSLKENDIALGTLDSYLIYHLTGKYHVTDPSNAGATGLLNMDASGWDQELMAALNITHSMLPTIVDSSNNNMEAVLIDKNPVISAFLGDQQASMVGQGVIKDQTAKATFGTGAMLNLCIGNIRPKFEFRGPDGTFPIAEFRIFGKLTWAIEALMLSCGSVLEWAKNDLQLIRDFSDIDEICPNQDSSELCFVPALFGLGTPHWDFGARSLFIGLTRSTSKEQLMRAIIEGLCYRSLELLRAAENDAGLKVNELRVDGNLTNSKFFLSRLADFLQIPILLSRQKEATTLGAALLALNSQFNSPDLSYVHALIKPAAVIEPGDQPEFARFDKAIRRAKATIPELSAISF